MGRLGRRLSIAPLTIVVAVVALVVTLAFAWASRTAHDENEDRLTQQSAREAIAVLTAGVPAIQAPLETSAGIARVVGSGDAGQFRRVIESQVGPERRFVSASVWPMDGTSAEVVVGEDTLLADLPPEEIAAFFDRAQAADTLSVLDLLDGDTPRLGYAFTSQDSSSDFLVYAEQALPADRTTVAQPDSAFAELDYALYLDTPERSGTLVIASTDELPLSGRQAQQDAPFGDGTLRLVVSPSEELGGSLLAALPWLVLSTGLVMTLAAVVLAETLQRRRAHADGLVAANAALYAEQRQTSIALQQSLLPRRLPVVPGVDLAVRYVPGVEGTEVGGDWYDVIEVDGRFVVVVGDVSGRGLPAASVMAEVRYSMRAFASEGDGPEEILRKVNALDAKDLGGHFATVLCGVVDLEAATLTLASAGHPPALLAGGAATSFVSTPVGPPVGVQPGATYDATTIPIHPRSTFVLFTDGLFERRGETITVGLERLRSAAAARDGSLDELLDGLLEDLTTDGGADDVAMLALRWQA